MDINKVFSTFVSKLKERRGFLSEDNVRFYWFVSMLEQDPELNHFSLEEPYRGVIKGHKELDLMYEKDGERFCIEIKFHRNSSTRTYAKPLAAGEIFDDICRLPHWEEPQNKDGKETRYLFLYVTDDEMHRYLSNNTAGQKNNSNYRNVLTDFYTLQKTASFECTFGEKETRPEVFNKQALASFGEAGSLHVPKLVMIDRDDIDCPSDSLKKIQNKTQDKDNFNCHIRLYEVFRKN